MKQKTFKSILRRLQGLPSDQAETLMRSVQDLTVQNTALGAVDQKQGWPVVLIVVLMRRKMEAHAASSISIGALQPYR